MVRFKGTPPYVEFVEFGKGPYPDQPQIDESTRHCLDLRWALMSEQSPEIVHLPVGARLYPEPASVPALRPEDV